MTWKPHATVAAVIHRDGKFLLVEEKIDGELVLNQPAGHLENGESLIQAVIREVDEETAWQFTPQYLLGVYRWRHPTKRHLNLRSNLVLACIDDFLAGEKAPLSLLRDID